MDNAARYAGAAALCDALHATMETVVGVDYSKALGRCLGRALVHAGPAYERRQHLPTPYGTLEEFIAFCNRELARIEAP